MRVSLECPTADVSAHDLGLLIDGPLPEILTARSYRTQWRRAETSLELGIIGASHVATVRHGDRTFREEISCFAGTPGSLVSQQRRRYALRADVATCPDFPDTATDLLAGLEGWLVAEFPGVGPFHITAVTGGFAAGVWEWQTHHLYPEEKIIVSTASRFEL